MAGGSESGKGGASVPDANATAPGDEAAPGTPGTGDVICPQCHGSGKVEGGKCPNCAGTGRVVKAIGGA